MRKGIKEEVQGSFRDPSGFLFFKDNHIYRQVNIEYKENYDHLISSGLYDRLVESKFLIPHDEVTDIDVGCANAYKVLKPKRIEFISYPYEWCFSQLKDAALTTLTVQKIALDYGMILKDASAYNVQFLEGKPIFIDTLSFEKYQDGKPWVAYRQFCQHFLAPLALMCYRDVRLNHLLKAYIDGIPLDLASSLLPTRALLKPSIFAHLFLHGKSQARYANSSVSKEKLAKVSIQSLRGLIHSLKSSIKKLVWHPEGTEWVDYYESNNNYELEAIEHKRQLLAKFLDIIKPTTVWDIGANTGLFSRIASDKNIQTVSFDIDPAAVEKSYLECINKHETNILPLLLDLTNPSPGIGWENQERYSFIERGPVDAVFALALIHHLSISNNVPLKKIADFFRKVSRFLIIEFIPKGDSQVQKLLSTREDIFPGYTQQAFEKEFNKFFMIKDFAQIKNSQRVLYLMERAQDA